MSDQKPTIPAGCKLLVPFSLDDLTWGDLRTLVEYGQAYSHTDLVQFERHNGGPITDIIIEG